MATTEKKRSLTHYQQIISEATGYTEIHDLRIIEDAMRNYIFHSTLDWQTRKQLEKGARDAVRLMIAENELKKLPKK